MFGRNKQQNINKSQNTSSIKTSVFADDELNEKFKKADNEQKRRMEQELREDEKQKLTEKRKQLLSFSEFKNPILLTIALAVVMLAVSLSYMRIDYAIYSILYIIFAIYAGKRIKDLSMNLKVWDALVFYSHECLEELTKYLNISPTDFLEKNYNKVVNCSLIIFLLMTGNSPLYIVGLLMLLTVFILTFAIDSESFSRFEYILKSKTKLLVVLFVGAVLKIILYSLLARTLYLDFSNLVVIVVLTGIFNFCNQIKTN